MECVSALCCFHSIPYTIIPNSKLPNMALLYWRYDGELAILRYFNEISHGNAVRPSLAVRPLKVSNLKIEDGRHLEKSKSRHISAAIRLISTKFGTATQFDPIDRSYC